MNRLSSRAGTSLAIVAGLALLVPALHERQAAACGGCFHGERPPNVPVTEQTSVVTDHRMALSISTTQTVLWDQVQYSGDPEEFAWVLPVRAGARLELSHDEWLAALNASTQTSITGPTPPRCPSARGREDVSSGGGGGCSASMSSSDDEPASAGGDFGARSDAGAVDPGDSVQIVSQSVVGPYEVVTLRTADGAAIERWLVANHFVLPATIAPVLSRYVEEGFDFIALKLRPGAGVRAMKPVRVVAPGAIPMLPLRMVAAGIGQSVGLTLYVITEGRYRPKNFPEAAVDPSQLAWDPRAQRSNYTELSQATMATAGGRTWLTSFAGPIPRFRSGQSTIGLSEAYSGICVPGQPYVVPCPGDRPPARADAGGDAAAVDAGEWLDASRADGASDAESDAARDAASSSEADAGEAPPPQCTMPGTPCDDVTVALTGLHPGDVWLTRLRANLPVAALSQDLELEPAPEQTPISNALIATRLTDPSFNACTGSSAAPSSLSRPDDGCACTTTGDGDRTVGGGLLFGAAGLAVAVLARRRRR